MKPFNPSADSGASGHNATESEPNGAGGTKSTRNTAAATGCVINIQRYSLHDGPGIRTVVFLKGCPLRCKWCSNPESWKSGQEVYLDPKKCIGTDPCTGCLDACPEQAISPQAGLASINRSLCTDCLLCAPKCPSTAISVYGQTMTVDQVLRIVEQESAFYKRSKGGLTVSGGEATVQADFTSALLSEAKRRRIGTALETCGYAPWSSLERLLPSLDYIYYDIKSVDAAKHKEFTGVDPELIIGNLRKLAQVFDPVRIVVRTPVVPGFNDREEDLLAISKLIKDIGDIRYELLKYHRFGSVKYDFLGKEYAMGAAELTEEAFERLQNALKQA
ncbi:MAG: hypothetical protein K0R57_1272 [Paenibacillaceae bacterium]|jgi:pyruvate formate lyase activating enzyme|nr:hypothetical protein [Paenibacillaceae bacterium]